MNAGTAFAAGLAAGVILTAAVIGLATLLHDLWFGKPDPR